MDTKIGADVIRAHMDSPRNFGKLTGPRTFSVAVPETACGDIAQLSLRLNEANTHVAQVQYKTFGCGRVIGCLSYISEWAQGKAIEEVASCNATELAMLFELPAHQHHCARLASYALTEALKQAQLSLGQPSNSAFEDEAVAALSVDPEGFFEADFAASLKRVREKFTARGSSPDWSRVAVRVARRIMGHDDEGAPLRSAAEVLADVRYLDGGLRQDVAARVLELFSSSGATPATGGA